MFIFKDNQFSDFVRFTISQKFKDFYNNSKESFEMDELDELYDFPKEITESSRVIFSLLRRDTKLELEHKIISNE